MKQSPANNDPADRFGLKAHNAEIEKGIRLLFYLMVVFVSLVLAFIVWEQAPSAKPARLVSGFVVAKEWQRGHVRDSVVIPITPQASAVAGHVRVPSVFRLWVANREGTRVVEVDSTRWGSLRCGQRCTYRYQE